METFLKILTVIGSIIVPLVIAFWNNRNLAKKHPKEEFAEDVKVAERFSRIINSNESLLIKDRITQQLFVSKNITFQEGLYFYQFNDSEKWVRNYIEVRDQLKLVRNSKNVILKIHHSRARLKFTGYAVGYVFFASLSIAPFLSINWFIDLYITSMEAKKYLIVLNMVIWPIIFFAIAIICLVQAAKYNDAKRFIKNFKSNAFKI